MDVSRETMAMSYDNTVIATGVITTGTVFYHAGVTMKGAGL